MINNKHAKFHFSVKPNTVQLLVVMFNATLELFKPKSILPLPPAKVFAVTAVFPGKTQLHFSIQEHIIT
jgi:hypothetical protein